MTNTTSLQPGSLHESLYNPAMQMTNEIRCGKCNKLLAKVGEVVGDLEIKCSRCKTINNTTN